jgi:hypothetical protein
MQRPEPYRCVVSPSKREDSSIELAQSLLELYHPFSPKGYGSVAHDQIRGMLLMLGFFFGCSSITEFPALNPQRKRGGRSRIDVVWIDCNLRPLVAFEIDRGFKGASIEKLKAIDAAYKIAISYSDYGLELKLLGSKMVVGTGIRHIVVRSTTDHHESQNSVLNILQRILELDGFPFKPHLIDDSVKAAKLSDFQ